MAEPLFPHADKVLHFITYSLLAFLAARSMANEKRGFSGNTVLWTAAAFSFLYGVSDEVHQAFVPSRTASFFDLIADGLGSVAGAVIFQTFFRKDNQDTTHGNL